MAGLVDIVSVILTAALEEDTCCRRFLFKTALGFYHMERNIFPSITLSSDHSKELGNYMYIIPTIISSKGTSSSFSLIKSASGMRLAMPFTAAARCWQDEHFAWLLSVGKRLRSGPLTSRFLMAAVLTVPATAT